MAKRKLAAFPNAFGDDSLNGIEVVGNPVRGPILEIEPSAQRYAQRQGKLNVLIVGGSLGAMAINEVVPKTLAKMDEALRPNVRHQAGARNIEQTQALYNALAIDADVTAFIDKMEEAYSWADLVICRAGALTVSEIAIAGVASLLVPFPFAVDDHQTANGQFLVDAGAAFLVAQKTLDENKLIELLAQLDNREKLADMADKAQQVGLPQASNTVANICLEEML